MSQPRRGVRLCESIFRPSRASGALVCQVPGLTGLLPRMVVWRIFPSSPRRGGCATKKKSRSILSTRRRGGVQPPQNSVEFDHHPVRSIKEASRYFIEVASTPPRRGGENSRHDHLGNCPPRPRVWVQITPTSSEPRPRAEARDYMMDRNWRIYLCLIEPQLQDIGCRQRSLD